MKIIKIRKVNKTAKGLTLPKESVEELDIKEGHYICDISKEGKEIIIKLKRLEES